MKPVVLITGTSSGFGYLFSVALAKHGYQVMASMRDLERSQNLKTLIEKEKLENIEIIKLDVTQLDEVKEAVSDIINRVGHIDVLINNAGYVEGGFAEELTIEDYRNQFETNFFGLVAVTKAVLPSMRKRGNGRIINISSVSGRVGFPILSPYVASKFAVEGFSESLRLELLPFGIYVTLIEPGSFKTEVWGKGLVKKEGWTDSPYYRKLAGMMAEIEKSAQNAGDPREVVDLLVRVIEAKRPKLRYLIGKGVNQYMCLKNVLPWEWIERQLLKRF
jgi:NAD(P)-dependent dehydrogenase (short-subunit alcohol dehydrogenase family)